MVSGCSTRCMNARSLRRVTGGRSSSNFPKFLLRPSIISSCTKEARGNSSSGSDMGHPIQQRGKPAVADEACATQAGELSYIIEAGLRDLDSCGYARLAFDHLRKAQRAHLET